MTAVAALPSGTDVFVVGAVDAAIEGCVGFALLRQPEGGPEQAVETWVGFEDEPADATGRHRASTEWPIQKTSWTDYRAPPSGRVRYGVTPVVMTGAASVAPAGVPAVWSASHNFSDRASHVNDDNLVIVEGDRALAAAYAVNVVGIYSQYRWQAWRNTADGQKDRGLKRNDIWLRERIGSEWLRRESRFWTGT